MKLSKYRLIQRQNSRRFKSYNKETQKTLRVRGYHNRGKKQVLKSRDLLNAYDNEVNTPEKSLDSELQEWQELFNRDMELLPKVRNHEELNKLTKNFNTYGLKLRILETNLAHVYRHKKACGEDLSLRSEEISNRADSLHNLQSVIAEAEVQAYHILCRLQLEKMELAAA